MKLTISDVEVSKKNHLESPLKKTSATLIMSEHFVEWSDIPMVIAPTVRVLPEKGPSGVAFTTMV